jgi:hypothetical protein
VKLTAIKTPETDWKSPLAAFEEAYKHEQKITALIENLINLANDDRISQISVDSLIIIENDCCCINTHYTNKKTKKRRKSS